MSKRMEERVRSFRVSTSPASIWFLIWSREAIRRFVELEKSDEASSSYMTAGCVRLPGGFVAWGNRGSWRRVEAMKEII